MSAKASVLLFTALVAIPACADEAPDTGGRTELSVVKIVLCHIPPGNPSNAHTIAVGSPAAIAHYAHGDVAGECGQVCAGEAGACIVDADCCLGSCQAGACHTLCQPGELADEACGLGVGACHFGTQTCNATGTGWEACVGAGAPTAEVCDGIDNDCDAVTDEGCVGGLAWNDKIMDGVQDAADAGPIAGMTFVLRAADTGAVVAVTTTDDDGLYGFAGVPVGAYVVEAFPPDYTWGFTTKDATDDARDSDFWWGEGDTGLTEAFEVDGATPVDLDAGLFQNTGT